MYEVQKVRSRLLAERVARRGRRRNAGRSRIDGAGGTETERVVVAVGETAAVARSNELGRRGAEGRRSHVRDDVDWLVRHGGFSLVWGVK